MSAAGTAGAFLQSGGLAVPAGIMAGEMALRTGEQPDRSCCRSRNFSVFGGGGVHFSCNLPDSCYITEDRRSKNIFQPDIQKERGLKWNFMMY